MFKSMLVIASVMFFAGCATVPDEKVTSRPSLELSRTSEEGARAKHYLSVLWAKKNRFEQANPELFDSDHELTASSASSKLVSSNCAKIDSARWADSVRYGQDFTSYENYVIAMERCLNSRQMEG